MAPSSATWNILEMAGVLPNSSTFLRTMRDVTRDGQEFTFRFEDVVQPALNLMMANTLPENEGYPQMLCTPVVAEVVDILNKTAGHDHLFQYSVKPVVFSDKDSRKNKRSDLSIIRIYNKRTFALVECKLAVNTVLTADHKTVKDLSQLFLEARYVYVAEGKTGDKMIVSLSDAKTWHMFVVDMSTMPITFLEYIKVSSDNIDTSGTTNKKVMKTLLYYIPGKL